MYRKYFNKASISKDKSAVILTIIVFASFFIIGTICSNFIGVNTAQRIYKIFVSTAINTGIFKAILTSLSYYLIIYLILLIFSTSAIGIPFLFAICGYVSFGSGFATSILYKYYGFNGILISIFSLSIPIFISSCLMIAYCSMCVMYSFSLFSFYSKAQRVKSQLPTLNLVLKRFVVFYSLNTVAVLYEVFISPIFIKVFLK